MKIANFVNHVLLLLFRDPFKFFLACLAFSFFLQVLGRIAVRDLLKMADSLIPTSMSSLIPTSMDSLIPTYMDNLIPTSLNNLIPSSLDLDLSVELDTVLHLLLITSINIVLVAILLGRRGNTDVVH